MFSIAPRFSLAGRDAEYEQVAIAWKEASTGSAPGGAHRGRTGHRQDPPRGRARPCGRPRWRLRLARPVRRRPRRSLPTVRGSARARRRPRARRRARGAPRPGARASCAGSCPSSRSGCPGLPPTTSDPETERYLLFEAIAGWLEAQSQLAPTLLVLDDLHWAAEPTLLMLRHVLGSDRDLNLLVVGTYRDTEVDRTHPLGALLAHLRRTEGVDRIALARPRRRRRRRPRRARVGPGAQRASTRAARPRYT